MGTSALIGHKLAPRSAYDDYSLISADEVLVATEVVESGIFGRVGVELAGGVAEGYFAHTVFVASAKQDDRQQQDGNGYEQSVHDEKVINAGWLDRCFLGRGDIVFYFAP